MAEARNNLSKLIDQALAGDEVVITRHGRAVATIKPMDVTECKKVTPDQLAWLERLRAQLPPSVEDGPALVSRMRDEDWR